MKRNLRTSVLFIFFALAGQAQIVNIESLRLSTDSLGFLGNENLNFSVVKNSQRSFNINNNLSLQYRAKRHIYLLLSNLAFNFSDAVSFERNGFAHFRYGYTLNTWFTPEALVQYQIDVPLRIEQRLLAGAGGRFKLTAAKRQKLYTGHLVLFEKDQELILTHSSFSNPAPVQVGEQTYSSIPFSRYEKTCKSQTLASNVRLVTVKL